VFVWNGECTTKVHQFLYPIFLLNLIARFKFVVKNSEPLMCRIEDGVFYISVITMKMFHRDQLMRRVSEIIDLLDEIFIYTHWNSRSIEYLKSHSRKIGIVHPLDEYYSFNLHHMQPAIYLLLMGWCLSAFCFIAEVLYYSVLSQTEINF